MIKGANRYICGELGGITFGASAKQLENNVDNRNPMTNARIHALTNARLSGSRKIWSGS